MERYRMRSRRRRERARGAECLRIHSARNGEVREAGHTVSSACSARVTTHRGSVPRARMSEPRRLLEFEFQL